MIFRLHNVAAGTIRWVDLGGTEVLRAFAKAKGYDGRNQRELQQCWGFEEAGNWQDYETLAEAEQEFLRAYHVIHLIEDVTT